ncbi:hypothetical protein A8C46_00270 [Ligilactobacillus salivarius]|uniref:Uncharacterized protein n=1 Tax=Ligilactobacillus salivarius TaxID=1624 RepID=A0A9X6SAU1_9LACO|nr:hypothetical protein A8C38_00370 [Ligilactobacillus salivarius]PAY43071.1 hypothetical protein A8C52_11510 [Ligilactobacillus salivarius]PAY43602.1 hypothetical protein A8C39_00550 [Ligilactobacillus salivarius]PAY49416.1 hypothetical protein A8C42_00695 [Ligilactobacillus salivarius]PAY58038.1 hypothetical protein A8C46_00270 [Ligilactobacillus salivarius]
MKIKEILDKYEVKYGDIIYVRDNDSFYMFTLETNNSCVVNLHDGHIHIYYWEHDVKETALRFFDNKNCVLINKSSLLKSAINMEGGVL